MLRLIILMFLRTIRSTMETKQRCICTCRRFNADGSDSFSTTAPLKARTYMLRWSLYLSCSFAFLRVTSIYHFAQLHRMQYHRRLKSKVHCLNFPNACSTFLSPPIPPQFLPLLRLRSRRQLIPKVPTDPPMSQHILHLPEHFPTSLAFQHRHGAIRQKLHLLDQIDSIPDYLRVSGIMSIPTDFIRETTPWTLIRNVSTAGK